MDVFLMAVFFLSKKKLIIIQIEQDERRVGEEIETSTKFRRPIVFLSVLKRLLLIYIYVNYP